MTWRCGSAVGIWADTTGTPKGVDVTDVHAKEAAAEQQRNAATSAARRAGQLARKRHDAVTSPGLAAATRHRDELKAETSHRGTLPPDQARAEQAAREQAAQERVIEHQAESTANVQRDLNGPEAGKDKNSHEY